LKSGKEWRAYCKGAIPGKTSKPHNIPANPLRVYRNSGWKSLGDWLGTGYVHHSKRSYLPFIEAKIFVHSLGLSTRREWQAYCDGKVPGKKPKPGNIPAHPEQSYKNQGWVSVGDWLGTDFVHQSMRSYLGFREARSFIHSLNLKSRDEWRAYCKGQLPKKGLKPANIPAAPQSVYKEKGWVSENDWLGIRP
jgi:hypothetical protein